MWSLAPDIPTIDESGLHGFELQQFYSVVAPAGTPSDIAILLWSITAVAAQSYPSQPIRLVIPFTAGGAADMVGRLIAQELGSALGQNVIVDNRGGAGTVIGSEIVAKAPPDGHPLLLVTPTYIINPSARKLPYDTVKDFAGVSMIAVTPLVKRSDRKFNPRSPTDMSHDGTESLACKPAARACGELQASGSGFRHASGVDKSRYGKSCAR